MFKTIIAVAICAIGGVAFYFRSFPPEVYRDQPSTARAVVEQYEWNFGQLAAGTPLHVTFVVRNEGTKRLILTEQDDCCSARDEQIIISPGEMDKVKRVIDTNQRQEGPGHEVLRYRTNDPDCPTLTFDLTYEITPAQPTSETRAGSDDKLFDSTTVGR